MADIDRKYDSATEDERRRKEERRWLTVARLSIADWASGRCEGKESHAKEVPRRIDWCA